MAAAEVHLTKAQAEKIVETFPRRVTLPVTVRQEADGDILVWLRRSPGTKQGIRRIKEDGQSRWAGLTPDQKAALKASKAR